MIPTPRYGRGEILARYNEARLDYLLELATDLGPVVDLKGGNFLVSDPAGVATVLRRTNDQFRSTQNLFRDRTRGAVGSESTDRWMQSRKVAAPALNACLQDHLHQVRAELQAVVQRWCGEGVITSAVAELEAVTNRAIVRLTLGEGAAKASGVTTSLLDHIIPLVSSTVVLPRWMQQRPSDRRRRAALRALQEIVGRSLKSRTTEYARILERSGIPFSWRVDVTMSALLAAIRVPAAAMAWGLVEIASRPDVQRRLRDASVELSDVRRELLRLWPPSWLFARDALAEVDVAGHRLPRGSHILISSWVLHRTNVWDDAMAFTPERWTSAPPPNAYIPYGAGKRYCMGASFANAQIDAFLGAVSDARIFPAGAAVYDSIDDRATLVPVGLKFRVGNI